jgi:hypothetical protein
MTTAAIVIADSISPGKKRLTTLQLRYPKFIHGEFMTHRVFSRNASSSRAIPVQRVIEDLRRDPAMPVFWGSNKPGMQAGGELPADEIDKCKGQWLRGMEDAIGRAIQLQESGLHKQIANRILEPWVHINVVVTATEWANFFELRCHPDAQPEMRVLAEAIRDAMNASTPQPLKPGCWHLPYVTDEEIDVRLVTHGEAEAYTYLIKLSVARCARVSYLTHEGKTPDAAEDLKLYDRLVGGVPIHASPAEHQGTPDEWYDGDFEGYGARWRRESLHGNFVGWQQYRKMLELQFA